MEVERRRRQDDAGETTEDEGDEEADRPDERRLERDRSDPRHIVPIQLKIFTPVGTAMSIVISAKNGSSTDPVTYMWCAHTVTERAAIAIVA